MNKKLVKPRLMIVSCLLLATAAFVSGQPRTPDAPAVEQSETRCGWFSNPTPANASLYDRAGEWIIGVQGGYQAEGDWPAFGPRQWVQTNGNYGYGCACLRLRVNRETHEVIVIESARARPLAACRRDRSLRRWGLGERFWRAAPNNGMQPTANSGAFMRETLDDLEIVCAAADGGREAADF